MVILPFVSNYIVIYLKITATLLMNLMILMMTTTKPTHLPFLQKLGVFQSCALIEEKGDEE